MHEQRVELEKSLRPLHVASLALGCIIGWGCFVLAGDFLARAGPLGATIGLLAGAALMLLIVESYGPLVERFPVAGAEFAHAYYAAGRYHAYLCGWFLTLGYLSIIPLNATVLALLGKFLAPELFARGLLYSVAGWNVYLGEVLLASTAILLVGYFNYRSVRSVGVFQLVLTSVLVGTVVLIAIGTFLSPGSAVENFRPLFTSGDISHSEKDGSRAAGCVCEGEQIGDMERANHREAACHPWILRDSGRANQLPT